MASNETTFAMMALLFKKKWMNCEPDFVYYFDKQWLSRHQNWYEGAAIYEVSTNNGFVSHNAFIKRYLQKMHVVIMHVGSTSESIIALVLAFRKGEIRFPKVILLFKSLGSL